MAMIRNICLILLLLLVNGTFVFSQVVEPGQVQQEVLESNAANNEANVTEDDAYLQLLERLAREPLNINRADENELAAPGFLSALQIANLLTYRKLLGRLIDIYELQAVPGWDVDMIRRLHVYLTVEDQFDLLRSIRKRLTKGRHMLLLRASQVLERSKGYGSASTNGYRGSPLKLLARYTYNYKNLLQWGILGEKDAGEQFFKGSQRSGFDFYSAHFFARDLGMIRSLALGDFTVNMGQGLIQWQGLAFTKSTDVLAIKRQSAILRPYHSSGEINFHRGAGITIGKKAWEATAFCSLRKIDANLLTDTLDRSENSVSSLQTSGYHRTNNELADKGSQRQLCYGANLSYHTGRLHLGLNAVHYHFNLPINKGSDPYNAFSFRGSRLTNYSLDYGYTWQNMHFFGELARGAGFIAFVNGLLISSSARTDLSFVYRNISRAYPSFYSNAFTENSRPVNEKGLFMGLAVRPLDGWQISAYTDMYVFPWLRYRSDGPAHGTDYMLNLKYTPNKHLGMSFLYRVGSKGINEGPTASILTLMGNPTRQDIKAGVNYQLSNHCRIQNGVMMAWYDRKGPAASQGILLYTELFYKMLRFHAVANIRLQYFETTDYNSRLYVYEHDVIYDYSIPASYGKGSRYYFNFQTALYKKISIWLRLSRSVFPAKTVIGSGLDEIPGKHKTEFKVQVSYKF